MTPDVLHVKLGPKDSYILKKNGMYVGQYGPHESAPGESPGKCLDWILLTHATHSNDKTCEIAEISDASGYFTETEIQSPEDIEGYPFK